ncbi:MAG1 [Auxenochlorella protothecoides x Auxenochlorella symbiontica]
MTGRLLRPRPARPLPASRGTNPTARNVASMGVPADKDAPAIETLLVMNDPVAATSLESQSPANAGPTVGLTMATLHEAVEHLKQVDARLLPLIEEHGPPSGLLAKEGSSFAALARSIIGQQLATKAAAVIFQRTLEACQCLDTGFLTPESLITTDMAALRACGLSQRKAEYLTGLARLFSDGVLTNEGIQGMDDATLTTELTKVRGLGQWSVHMFAMFHLGHPDILPVGDLGVRKGMQWLYGLKDLPDPETMEGVAAAWKPYRSVGSHYMWSAAASAPRSPNKKKAQSPAKRKKAAAAGELDGEKPT